MSWSQTNVPINVSWLSIAMSRDGKYQSVGGYVYGVYYSKDYGINWYQTNVPIDGVWYSIAMSSDGKYQTV